MKMEQAMNDIEDRVSKLDGLYRGKVLKHLEHGILKVFIPGVYPQEWAADPDKLPDAEQLVPTFGGNSNGNGVFSYPNIGAIVICQFLNGDQNLPIVIGTTQGGALAAMKYKEIANELDPATGEKPSYVHMVSVGRSKVKLYEGGMVEMDVTGKDGKSASFKIDQNGNVFVNCDGTFQVQANNIKLMAKNQVGAASGKTMVLNSKSTMSMAADGVIVFCPNSVMSVSSKNRITTM